MNLDKKPFKRSLTLEGLCFIMNLKKNIITTELKRSLIRSYTEFCIHSVKLCANSIFNSVVKYQIEKFKNPKNHETNPKS